MLVIIQKLSKLPHFCQTDMRWGWGDHIKIIIIYVNQATQINDQISAQSANMNKEIQDIVTPFSSLQSKVSSACHYTNYSNT